jgi:hypothetical protein
MKCLKSILFGAALILVSGAVLATGNLKVDIKPAGEHKTLVHITNAESSNYEIELVNSKGDVVFYKKTDSPSDLYSKYYDFSKLENGIYSLSVNINKEKKVNTLKLNKGRVEVLEQKTEVEPYFTIRENRLEMSYLNYAQENLSLMFYDGNKLLYKKKLEPEFTIIQGLDLSNLESGNYNAVLATENNHFEYPVKLK